MSTCNDIMRHHRLTLCPMPHPCSLCHQQIPLPSSDQGAGKSSCLGTDCHVLYARLLHWAQCCCVVLMQLLVTGGIQAMQ